MSKYGLKGSHAQYLLVLLNSDGGLSATEFCRLCDKDKAAISRTVTELERERLIQKSQNGAGVYRVKYSLTGKGEKIATELSRVASVAVKKANAGIGENELLAFYNTLDVFAKNLDKMSREEL